jgi:hypothetical protein
MKINSAGVNYCEEDSFSRNGIPLISFTNVIASDSSSIFIQIGDQSKINFSRSPEIINHIYNIRQEIPNSGLNENLSVLIIEKIDQLETLINSNKNPPVGFWEWLSRIDTTTSLGQLVVAL